MDHERPTNVHVEIRAHSKMNQTRKAKERDDPVRLLRQIHRTEIRMKKVVMLEVQKAHQSLPAKVVRNMLTDYFKKLQEGMLSDGKSF